MALRADRPPLAMFDRGPYFAEMKKKGMVNYPKDWVNPDVGWAAQPVG